MLIGCRRCLQSNVVVVFWGGLHDSLHVPQARTSGGTNRVINDRLKWYRNDFQAGWSGMPTPGQNKRANYQRGFLNVDQGGQYGCAAGRTSFFGTATLTAIFFKNLNFWTISNAPFSSALPHTRRNCNMLYYGESADADRMLIGC